jgi:hypothetical protein
LTFSVDYLTAALKRIPFARLPAAAFLFCVNAMQKLKHSKELLDIIHPLKTAILLYIV